MGTDPQVILGAMTTAMTEVGRKFACNEGVYVPESLISAHAMKEVSVLLEFGFLGRERDDVALKGLEVLEVCPLGRRHGTR